MPRLTCSPHSGVVSRAAVVGKGSDGLVAKGMTEPFALEPLALRVLAKRVGNGGAVLGGPFLAREVRGNKTVLPTKPLELAGVPGLAGPRLAPVMAEPVVIGKSVTWKSGHESFTC